MRSFCLLIFATLAAAQTPQFEVATIRPSDPLTRESIASGKLNIGIRVNGNQVNYGYLSLRDLVVAAYGVKPAQVAGPEWMPQQRFDILALMPEGSTEEQAPAMLQALLRDRFKLVVKKEAREQSAYALQVAKDGPKMQLAPPLPEAPPDTETDNKKDAPGKGGQVLSIGGRDIRVNQAGGPGSGNVSISGGRGGNQKISMGADGQMHIEIERMTMPMLADTLASMLDLPVVDQTKLDDAFQVSLDLGLGDLLGAISKAGISLPAAGARLGAATGGNPGGIAGPGAPGLNAADPSGSIFSSVQKLGLKLEKQKTMVETVVVESAERNPSEN